MESRDVDSLKKQRQRRRRVARMKVMILAGSAFLMLLLSACCIFLLVRVVKLQHEFDDLNAEISSLRETLDEINTRTENIGYMSDGNVSESQSLYIPAGDDVSSGDAVTLLTDGEYGIDAPQEIYITFDDGPSDNTAEILDILAKHDIKATFFVIGKEDEDSVEMYKRIVEEGHTLGMHSYSHKYSALYESVESFSADIEKERAYLYEITGVEPWLFRFPGGSSNLISNTNIQELISYLDTVGISYIDWNISTGDATNGYYTSEDFMRNVMKDIGKYRTAVILMHDTNSKTVTLNTLDELLSELEKRDAVFKAIDKETNLIQQIKSESVNEE